MYRVQGLTNDHVLLYSCFTHRSNCFWIQVCIRQVVLSPDATFWLPLARLFTIIDQFNYFFREGRV